MPALPSVDVNLFVRNGADTVGPAIESVLAQTWPSLTLTLIDDGSTDDTAAILRAYAARDQAIRLKRNRINTGAVASFQRAFWFGDADYVLPKSGDDLLAPDFVEKAIAVLRAHPDCAMCHAAGLIFDGRSQIRAFYPPEHCLHAVGADPVERARHVMQRYTSSPSFWGIYRRDAVDRLSSIRYRAGWDHALLAELALYGEIRHVAEPLYWRRDGGKPVRELARAATEQGSRGLELEGRLAEQRWRVPLITTAHAHIEVFAAARADEDVRAAAMAAVPDSFRGRWLPLLRREAADIKAMLPTLLSARDAAPPAAAAWMTGALRDVLRAVAAIVPEAGLTEDLSLVAPPAREVA